REVLLLAFAAGQEVEAESLQHEGERDSGGRDLRERDAPEHEAAKDEVHPDEGADEADDDAAPHRVVQKEAGLEHLEHRAHSSDLKISASLPFDSISSEGPVVTAPSSTQAMWVKRPFSALTRWLTMRTVRLSLSL